MKKVITLAFAVLVLAGSLISCKKTTAEQLVGRYGYKMSGSFVAEPVDGTGSEKTLKISNQWGQMYLTSADGNNNFIVNMSAFMGELLSFTGHLSNDTLTLKKHTITVQVKETGSGTSLVSDNIPLRLTFSGASKNYGNTLMFVMNCEGEFELEEEVSEMVSRSVNYKVKEGSCDIICFGQKEE